MLMESAPGFLSVSIVSHLRTYAFILRIYFTLGANSKTGMEQLLSGESLKVSNDPTVPINCK